jgi:prepilin-type N-terminal cleavage/methylation domain-containing protein
MDMLNDNPKKNRDGFTVIELLAVLLITGLVMGLGIPIFKRTLADYQLQQTAERLAWEIRAQQQEAMADGTPRQIEFFYYGGYYKILKPQPRNVFFPEDVAYAYLTLPKSGGNRYLLILNASGSPNLGGTVALKNDYGRERYVVINPVIGRVRVSDVPPE